VDEHKENHPVQRPVWVTVRKTKELSGLGTTKIYELLAKRQLRSIKVGRRRLVEYSSIENLINTSAGDFTAEDLEEFLATKLLSSTVVGNRMLRRTASKLKKQELRSDNGGTELKPVLHFADSPQLLPLNKTNLRTLYAELGDPQVWAGAVIGIFTDPTVTYNGKPALRVKVLKAPATKPGPDGPGFDDEIQY